MTTTNKPVRPQNLDPTRRYSPAEVDQWKRAWQDYREAVQAEADRQRLKEQAAHAHANRSLTRDEYHALTNKRGAEQQARDAERQAAKKAEQDEQAAYLASLPEVAEILEASEFRFLAQCQHWFARGYEMSDDSIKFFVPGCYAVSLTKPAAAKRSK